VEGEGGKGQEGGERKGDKDGMERDRKTWEMGWLPLRNSCIRPCMPSTTKQFLSIT